MLEGSITALTYVFSVASLWSGHYPIWAMAKIFGMFSIKSLFGVLVLTSQKSHNDDVTVSVSMLISVTVLLVSYRFERTGIAPAQQFIKL